MDHAFTSAHFKAGRKILNLLKEVRVSNQKRKNRKQIEDNTKTTKTDT